MASSRVKSPPPPQKGPAGFYLLMGVLVLVGAGLLVYLMRRPKDVSIPANVTVLAADTAGFRGYLLGSDSAKVEISEYADYQCPGCQYFETVQFPSVRKELIETGLVRWRYRDFPLDQIHRHARLAAHSAACAAEQGKYWEQHRAIYESQSEWAQASSAGPILRNVAQQVGLDLARYDECMSSAKYAGRIEASLQEGVKLGVNSTPTFLINGRLYPLGMTSDSLAAMVRRLTGTPAAQ